MLSGSPLATPCKYVAEAASDESPGRLQATGNSNVEDTPINASLRVNFLANLCSVESVILKSPIPALNTKPDGATLHCAPF